MLRVEQQPSALSSACQALLTSSAAAEAEGGSEPHTLWLFAAPRREREAVNLSEALAAFVAANLSADRSWYMLWSNASLHVRGTLLPWTDDLHAHAHQPLTGQGVDASAGDEAAGGLQELQIAAAHCPSLHAQLRPDPVATGFAEAIAMTDPAAAWTDRHIAWPLSLGLSLKGMSALGPNALTNTWRRVNRQYYAYARTQSHANARAHACTRT